MGITIIYVRQVLTAEPEQGPELPLDALLEEVVNNPCFEQVGVPLPLIGKLMVKNPYFCHIPQNRRKPTVTSEIFNPISSSCWTYYLWESV